MNLKKAFLAHKRREIKKMAGGLSRSCSLSLSSSFYAFNTCALLKSPKHFKLGTIKFPNYSVSSSDFKAQQRFSPIICQIEPDPDDEVDNIGVKAALSMLNFYKREISPVLPKSCRYVPSCSEYSMIAYKKYGVLKGTVLTAWRLCRCNPLGGSGFDPPRWFGEEKLSEDEDL